jgi:hypothetical protein
MNRRQLISNAAAAWLLQSLPRLSSAQGTGTATLALDTAAPRIPLPADYTGLSYESAQLGHPGYFSPDHKELVALFSQLGSSGVLRLGGSTSDYDHWKPERVAHDALWDQPANPDTSQGATVQAPVTETAVDELRRFLDATGWTAIYGIDLGHGSPESAADEAAYVVEKLGPKLVALQIGNEPDLFARDLRPANWGFTDYLAEWRKFADAIRRRTPDAPLAGPDITDATAWVDQFAKQTAGICMLTSHYYAEGPPESPQSNIPRLLQPRPDLLERMRHLVSVAHSAHLPYRMSEGNSCYNGGKPGVSDALASALWGADFMLLLAQLGVAGINFHGGGKGFYTPIAGGGAVPLQTRPLFYGMLFYREFASGSLIPCRFETGGVNATAYACLNPAGRLSLALINKDIDRDLHLKLEGALLQRPGRQITLQAPAVNSTTDVTLGGQAVVGGAFHPGYMPHRAGAEVSVPHASALLLVLEEIQP